MTNEFQKSMLTGLRAIATTPLLITAFLAAKIISKAPNFEQIYDAMFNGGALPLLSASVVEYWFLWISLVFITSITALAFIWRTSSPAIVGFVSMSASLILFSVFWIAQLSLFLPLVEIINKMGQP